MEHPAKAATTTEEALERLYVEVAGLARQRDNRRQRWKVIHPVLGFGSAALGVLTTYTILMDQLSATYRAVLAFLAAVGALAVTAFSTEQRLSEARRMRAEWLNLRDDIDSARTLVQEGSLRGGGLRDRLEELRDRKKKLRLEEDGGNGQAQR